MLRCTLEMTPYRRRLENRLRETHPQGRPALRRRASRCYASNPACPFYECCRGSLTAWMQQKKALRSEHHRYSHNRQVYQESRHRRVPHQSDSQRLKGHRLAIAGRETQIDSMGAPRASYQREASLRRVVLVFRIVGPSATAWCHATGRPTIRKVFCRTARMEAQ
jgi:hypothetical protein